jgi:hypothetical protein
MKSIRTEQLSMIHLFGEPEFQLKRLNAIKNDDFQSWTDLEKATYYMAARKLIEDELRGYDRARDQEGFAGLLRNRYETFLAQANIDPRPHHKIVSLLQLSQIAEHEEGQGEGDKYFQKALEWIPKVEVKYQEEMAEVFADGFKATPKGLGVLFLRTINSWEPENIFHLAIEVFETMAEAGQADEIEYRAMAEATINYFRNEHEAELVLRLTNRLVQLAREYQAEDRSFFWKSAYNAACGYGEPYTKMLMAVLLGDQMMKQENWQALEEYLKDIDEVISVYGAEDTFGSNFDQISEAVADMREALADHLS